MVCRWTQFPQTVYHLRILVRLLLNDPLCQLPDSIAAQTPTPLFELLAPSVPDLGLPIPSSNLPRISWRHHQSAIESVEVKPHTEVLMRRPLLIFVKRIDNNVKIIDPVGDASDIDIGAVEKKRS